MDLPEMTNEDAPPPSTAKARPGKGSPQRDMVWTFLSSGGSSLIQFLVLIFLSKLLTPKEVGWGQAVLVVSVLSTMLTEMGVAPSIVQRPVLTTGHIASGIISSFVTGMMMTLGVILLAGPIAGAFRMPEIEILLQVTSVVFVLNATSRIGMSRLMRNLRFRKMAQIEVTTTFAYAVTSVGLAYAGYGVWSIVAGIIAQAALQAVFVFILEPPPRPFKFDLKAYKDLMSVAKGFTAGALLGQAASQVDNFIIGRFFGPASLGLYSRAYSLMARPALVLASSVNRVMHPHMARVQDDQEQLKSLFVKSTLGVASTVLPFSMVAAVLAPEVVLVLLGEPWRGAILPFQILAAGMIFRIGNQSGDAITRAVADTRARIVPKACYLAAVILFSMACLQYGIAGVAAAVILGNIVHAFLVNVYAFKHVGMRWAEYLRSFRAPVLLTLVATLPTWGLATAFRAADLSKALTLIGGLVLSGLSIWLLLKFAGERVLGPDILSMKSSFRNLLSKKLKSGSAQEQ